MNAMTPLRLLAVSAIALGLSSCFNKKADDGYDTANPYGVPEYGGSSGQAAATPAQPSNPVYDTPAAYEEHGSAAPAADTATVDPGVAPGTTHRRPAATTPPATSRPTAGAAVHEVVKGDTLGGIAKKYGVTQAAIKQANGMTSDVVVLGKKLQIPAH